MDHKMKNLKQHWHAMAKKKKTPTNTSLKIITENNFRKNKFT